MAKIGPASIENRLRRIEGQIRGIEKLVVAKEPIQKTLIQVQAAISSLESVKIELVKASMKDKLLAEVNDLVALLK